MKPLKTLFFTLLLGSVAYADRYSAGESIYFEKGCQSCHGLQAQGLHEFPKLANQKVKVLRSKLLDYQNDRIKTPQASIMTPFAKALSSQEVELVIEFLSHFKVRESQERYETEFSTWGDGGS
ncbi:MAG: hypothetical protein KU37_08375 [Sulfuricurvum sp. PC08-66]|nr:MAG: hypothetical protein KU37_08375 [Sulfuricurvum sp. PC08-66]